MALDTELLDRFERDWNDALAHYEARTTASRLGNVQYDPSSMTFAPQEQDPKVAAGIQNELFGPLQAKWGLLSEAGRGRSSSGGGVSPQPSQRFFQTRDGVFALDPLTMESEKVIDVPRTQTQTSTRGPAVSVGDRAVLGSLGRMFGEASVLADDPNASPAMRQREQARRDAIAAQMSAIESKYRPAMTNAPAIAPQQWQVPPESIPFGNPGNPDIFMGDPMSPAIQDPPPAPLPGGPSVQRSLRILNIRPTGSR